MDKKEIQKKYLEYQLLDEKIKQLQQQQHALDQQLIEIMATMQSLDEFERLEDNSEILVPVNNGIFARAKLKKESNLLVNVGASVVVNKSIEKTKQLIEKQKHSAEQLYAKFSTNISLLVARASAIEKELNDELEK